jgi:yecA family protein
MAYQAITTIFQSNECDLTASEAHGLAAGMLCIENEIEVANWLSELFPEDVFLVEEEKAILEGLFEQTRKLLNEDDESFRFDLFLPNEDGLLKEQLEAIRYWCDGFLFGVGYTRSSSDWPGETGEIMQDIVEFTKLDTELSDEMDEDEIDEHESALIEIQEYIRVAVIMIRDQFTAENTQQKH